MHKIISSFHYTKALRRLFVWAIFISFAGIIFSTNIIATPQGVAFAPSQVHAADICDVGLNFGIIECVTKVVLFAPAQLFSLGVGVAVTLIGFATDPNVFNKLFDLKSVYTAWGVVRDIFNIAFIFVLLFSAFATIFQVQKYHLKNILLMVILMALLVNFSWPLAGLIIDFSNVLMLFFLGDQTGLSLSSGIGKDSNFANTLLPENGGPQNNPYMTLIMIDIFVFIFMVTMLAVAFQLFIRTIALLVLLIFSPIGIAGAAIPKMQGLSKMWWESFIRYSFTGPIAIFMLIFAAALMQDFASSNIPDDLLASGVSTSAAYGLGLMGEIQKFMIPMIILWVGVIASSKLSDVGSKFVTSRARSWGVAGGKRFAKTYARTVGNVATVGNAARVEGAVAGKFRGIGAQYDNYKTRAAGKRQAISDREKAIHLAGESYSSGGDPYAVIKHNRTDTAEKAKEYASSGIGSTEASKLYKTAIGNDKEALAKFMTSTDAIKSDEDLQNVLLAFNDDIKNAKLNPTKENKKLAEKAQRNAGKAINSLDDFGVSKFEQTQYKEIVDGLKDTTIGKEIVTDLDQKLIAKKRYDLRTEYEIKTDKGDPTAVIKQLSVAQVAESEKLAGVLARNEKENPQQVSKLALAVQKKISESPKAREQYQMKKKDSVEDLYNDAGVITP